MLKKLIKSNSSILPPLGTTLFSPKKGHIGTNFSFTDYVTIINLFFTMIGTAKTKTKYFMCKYRKDIN